MRASLSFFAKFGSKVALVLVASLAVAVLTGCSGVESAEEPVGTAQQASCTPSGWDVQSGANAYDSWTTGNYPSTECGYAMLEVDNISGVLFNVTAQWNGSTTLGSTACYASTVYMKDSILVGGTWTPNFTGIYGHGTPCGTNCCIPAFVSDSTVHNGNSYLFYSGATSCQPSGLPCTRNENCCSGTCTGGTTCAHGGVQTPEEAINIGAN